jgi:putative hydrolase of the HAD superfamily
MGIISNAQFYTPLLLRWFLKADPTDIGFVKDLLIYSFEIGRAKPSPSLFKIAASRLKKMGVFPESILYVGNDVRKDLLPAKQTGFQTALFAGDARSLRLGDDASAHRLASADLIITDLSQLLPYIKGHAER